MNDKIGNSINYEEDILYLKSSQESLKNNNDLFVKFTNDTLYNIKDELKNKVSLNEFDEFKNKTNDKFLQ